MGLRGGDTFQAADPQREPHLWIILSAPERYPEAPVLIVNLTSLRPGSETTCLLTRGDHPFIRHKSCVNYRDSRLVDRRKLEDAFERRLLLRRRRMSARLLRRIRAGAAASPRIPLANLQILRDQGLVD